MRTASNLAESCKEYILNTSLEVKCYTSLLSGDTAVCVCWKGEYIKKSQIGG